MTFKIPGISLGSSAKKRYSRKMSFDNNTTLPFGVVQPLLSQRLEAGSDIRVSMRQLVRLSPLVAPSFARVHLQTESVFVPFSDVCPFYEALVAQQYYNSGSSTFIPTELPYTSNAFLVYLLLTKYSYYTVYDTGDGATASTTSFTKLSIDSAGTLVSNMRNAFIKRFVSSYSLTVLPDVLPYLTIDNYHDNTTVFWPDGGQRQVNVNSRIIEPTPEGCDFVVKIHSDTKRYYVLCFNLTSIGRRIRTNLLGLGYSLDVSDKQRVSILPILSYLKAYYDTYAPSRTSSWLQSSEYALIKRIELYDYVDFCGMNPNHFNNNSPEYKVFFECIERLANTWYTSPDNFVSIQRPTPSLVDSNVSLKMYNYAGLSNTVYANAKQSPAMTASTPIDNIHLQAIQRLTRFINKDSIIGQKMSDWVRVHFGADVANQLYKNVYHLGSSRLDIQINDVLSTSDTASVDSDGNASGEILGAFAGRGLGYDNSGFKFHNDVPGYVFVMAAIVPETGFYQGNSGDLYCINRDTIPFPDYDALGFEATPRGMVLGSNDIYIDESTDEITDKTFGFVPRYTSLKVKKNIVNGDMSLRSTINSNSPYYLDRILTSNVVSCTTTTDSNQNTKYTIQFKHSDLPTASEEWRYTCRYPWLGNFNRIFDNSGDLNHGGSLFDESKESLYGNYISDNFILQSVFDVTVKDWYKPIDNFARAVPLFRSCGTKLFTLMVPLISELWYRYRKSEMSVVMRCSIRTVA